MKAKARILSGFLTIVAIMTVFLFSCEQSEEPKETPSVGLLFPTATERWGEEAPLIKELLKDDGYSCTLKYADEGGPGETSVIKQFAKDGIDILVYCYSDDTVAAANIAIAKDADMKVICYDRLATGTADIDCYVSVDNIKIGETMGKYLVSMLPAGATAAPLFLYTGGKTDYNSVLFFRGSWNILQPKIADGTFTVMNSAKAIELKASATLTDAQIYSVIDETTTDWSADTAATLAANDVGTQTGTIYVLAPNDTTSLALYAEFAKKCSKIHITGQDGITAAIQAIIDGKQGMTILKRAAMVARTAAKVAAIYADGDTPSKDDLSSYNNGTADIPFYGAELIYIDSIDDIKKAIQDGELNASDFTGL